MLCLPQILEVTCSSKLKNVEKVAAIAVDHFFSNKDQEDRSLERLTTEVSICLL